MLDITWFFVAKLRRDLSVIILNDITLWIFYHHLKISPQPFCYDAFVIAGLMFLFRVRVSINLNNLALNL
jgi:hypothetical protein